MKIKVSIPCSLISFEKRKEILKEEHRFTPLGNCSGIALLTYIFVGITQALAPSGERA
ncbi:MAG: hypothetical protein GQ475_06465 [Methylococcaceae bacterium]|nr:hypothetical protein [Methylococcaceae bacterium]